MDSEIFKYFNSTRQAFSPYGLTCEIWSPHVMQQPDRHNEIEINFFPDKGITYLFHDKKITIPARQLVIFWGLRPHQIVHYENESPYYVCTIPLSQFLSWKLPAWFVDAILQGRILMETDRRYADFDEFMLRNWISDITEANNKKIIQLEMRARLTRLASQTNEDKSSLGIQEHETSLVEKLAIYIAKNYQNPLKSKDISEHVGIHPDYANHIFKKAFGYTINEYIATERISHAQRLLLTTDMSITDIAYDSGFSSISRFNTVFLKISHCTPRDFRKKRLTE